METLYSGETILLIFPDGTGPALLSAMIAGIPFNRVHEMEFDPGELRMDVTKASVLDFLQERATVQKQEYAKIIASGRDELTRLRSRDDIVSLKDQKIEAERIAIDQETQKRGDRRLQEEGELRESRVQRVRQLEAEVRENKLQRASERGGGRLKDGVGDNSNQLAAAAAAAGAVGFAGAFAASGGDTEGNTKTGEDTKTSLKSSDKSIGSVNIDEVKGVELLDVESNSRPSAAPIASLQPPAPVNPYEAAEKAMEEYLDRDDGAGDWLSVVSSIIDDDDDEKSSSSDESSTETKSFE